MGTFSTRFLGCKVSQTDVQAIRERLIADGHTEAQGETDVAIVNACCVTHEAVRKSRQAARQAARKARRVYVTGCGANLAGAWDGLPEEVKVVALPSERTASSSPATSARSAACATTSRPRPHPRLREGAGRLQLLVRVLRRPDGTRGVALAPC